MAGVTGGMSYGAGGNGYGYGGSGDGKYQSYNNKKINKITQKIVLKVYNKI